MEKGERGLPTGVSRRDLQLVRDLHQVVHGWVPFAALDEADIAMGGRILGSAHDEQARACSACTPG